MQSKNIAFLGKSGTGTTTVAANVAAALAEAGKRVVFIGCGARADASSALRGGRQVQTLYDALHGGVRVRIDATAALRGGQEVQTLYDALHGGTPLRPEALAVEGFKGVRCLEIGAPVVGGCSGRIFRETMALLFRLRLLEAYNPEYILLDIPGDANCEGLTTILGSGHVHQAVLVTRADYAALRTVNELLQALVTLVGEGVPKIAGIVGNDLTGPFEKGIIEDFAGATGVEVLAGVPRSPVVMQSHLLGETVIENAPLALHAYAYRKLARRLMALEGSRRPRPLDAESLKRWAACWAECIYKIDGGFIDKGEAI